MDEIARRAAGRFLRPGGSASSALTLRCNPLSPSSREVKRVERIEDAAQVEHMGPESARSTWSVAGKFRRKDEIGLGFIDNFDEHLRQGDTVLFPEFRQVRIEFNAADRDFGTAYPLQCGTSGGLRILELASIRRTPRNGRQRPTAAVDWHPRVYTLVR